MADSQNTIAVTVIDAVAPEIAPKLIAIADASDKAGVSVGNLADQMATLKGSGMGTLAGMLDKLQAGTIKAATAQGTLAAQVRNTTLACTQQATALGVNATALTSTTAATKAAANAGNTQAATTNAQTAGTTKLVSANISAAAGLGILEGRTLSMNRAAANFVTRILGLGPVLQQAFVVIGAIALVAVLVQMGDALYNVIKTALEASREIAKAFDSVINPLRKTNDELALTNDKLESTIARLEHKPTTNGVATALDEARVMADKLDDSLEHVSNDLDTLLKKNQVGFLGSVFTNQSMTKDTSKFIEDQFNGIQAAREKAVTALDSAAKNKDPKAAQAAVIQAYADERNAIGSVVTAIEGEYNAKKKLKTGVEVGDNGQITAIYQDQTANLTELGKAGHLAQQEMRNLDLTMTNLTDNAKADKLHDQVSAESSAVKEAAKQWKVLEAAYMSWITTSEKGGHKPTASESLQEWQTLGKGINPLNQEKLDAKEQPFLGKMAGDSEWVKDQSDKLKNQIAEIGQYDDALKEAAMNNTIAQEAQKKGIVLTAAQTAEFKKQIATIVENKDYQRELSDIYKSVNDASDIYAAKTRALGTLLKDGVLTQDQYNSALARTTRDYHEATDAVTAFQRRLDEQKIDAGNKLGSNQDIAAKGALQGLVAQMRRGDASHPGGYSEQQIAAVIAGKMADVKAQQIKNATDEAANKLIYAQTNLYDELIIKEKALDAAVKAGTMSQAAANAAKLQDWNQQNDQQLKSGNGGHPFAGALADYAKQFVSVNQSIKESFSSTFKTLADGFADTIGKAIVGAKNLGAALKEVARSAIGELISSLIKLAIEYFIINKLQKAFKITPPPTVAGPSGKQAAEGIAGMAGITVAGLIMTKLLTEPMWNLAAAMAGVTFGISAAAGAASITALGSAEQAAKGHADGGYITGPGTARSDSVMARLSNGEYVVNASAVSQHRDLLDAINSGSSRETISTQFAPQINSSSNGTPRSNMKVEVHNYNGSRVETQHLSENQVRVIVRDEAPQLVAKHAPGVIANSLGDPNSKPSKALARSTNTTRNR